MAELDNVGNREVDKLLDLVPDNEIEVVAHLVDLRARHGLERGRAGIARAVVRRMVYYSYLFRKKNCTRSVCIPEQP